MICSNTRDLTSHARFLSLSLSYSYLHSLLLHSLHSLMLSTSCLSVFCILHSFFSILFNILFLIISQSMQICSLLADRAFYLMIMSCLSMYLTAVMLFSSLLFQRMSLIKYSEIIS